MSVQNPERILQRLDWTVIRRLDGLLQGDYRTLFHGFGLDLAELREYQLTDDVRYIDWNVTARMGHPYVKRFKEERELTVILAVDISASGMFGSQERSKLDTAVQVAAVLMFSALKNNDKAGLVLFAGGVRRYVPPRKGRAHVLRHRIILSYEAEAEEKTTEWVVKRILESVPVP